MKKISLLISFCVVLSTLFAQSTKGKSINNGAVEHEKVDMEKIKQACEDLPMDKRVRIKVSKFVVQTSTDMRDDATKERQANRALIKSIFGKKDGAKSDDEKEQTILGDNLSSMLSNALSGVNCFRVLASTNDEADVTNELDKGDSSNKYIHKKTAVKKGRMETANIVVKGAIVEYSKKQKGTNVLGVHTGKEYMKIGVNLQLLNAETGDLLVSRIVHAEGLTGSSTSYGFISSSNSDPNIAGITEDCIAQGVQFLAKMRDSLHLTADGGYQGSSGGDNETVITVSNLNFAGYTAFANLLGQTPSFKSLDKSFSGGVGTFTVTHAGSTDKYVDELTNKIGSKYEVTGVSGDNIEIKAK